MRTNSRSPAVRVYGMLALFIAVFSLSLRAQVSPKLEPLTGIRPPEPPNLGDFIKDKEASLILGKALFWEMGAGSDDIQACASCHFAAGADPRIKNQLDPNLTNLAGPPVSETFDRTASGGKGGPNYTLREGDFPFHILSNPLHRDSDIIFTTNDVNSSQGVFATLYGGIFNGQKEVFDDLESIFYVGAPPNDLHTRKVEPRQTPTTINAALLFRNFWDGRANNVFNGVNPFGLRDPDARIWVAQWNGYFTEVRPRRIALINSSAASQSVGPPLSDFEMSSVGRTFPELGFKLLGFIDDRATGDHIGYRGLPLLGTLNEADEIIRREGIDHLYVALPLEEHVKMLGLVDWQLLVLFIGLFIVNHALEKTGLPNDAVAWLRSAGIPLDQPGPLFLVTFILSNIVSNVPAVMLLLPVATHQLAGALLATPRSVEAASAIAGAVPITLALKIAFSSGRRYTSWWKQNLSGDRRSVLIRTSNTSPLRSGHR